jgi:hypothetical protein
MSLFGSQHGVDTVFERLKMFFYDFQNSLRIDIPQVIVH